MNPLGKMCLGFCVVGFAAAVLWGSQGAEEAAPVPAAPAAAEPEQPACPDCHNAHAAGVSCTGAVVERRVVRSVVVNRGVALNRCHGAAAAPSCHGRHVVAKRHVGLAERIHSRQAARRAARCHGGLLVRERHVVHRTRLLGRRNCGG